MKAHGRCTLLRDDLNALIYVMGNRYCKCVVVVSCFVRRARYWNWHGNAPMQQCLFFQFAFLVAASILEAALHKCLHVVEESRPQQVHVDHDLIRPARLAEHAGPAVAISLYHGQSAAEICIVQLEEIVAQTHALVDGGHALRVALAGLAALVQRGVRLLELARKRVCEVIELASVLGARGESQWINVREEGRGKVQCGVYVGA